LISWWKANVKETISRLLAYSKEFFVAGERELEQNTGLAHMQAVLKFHDAVEYCVRAIVEEHNVNHDRNADLVPLMKCISQSITTKKLPLSSQIDFLNTTRGKIKHHASVPSLEDVQRCHLYARDFLQQVTKEYLNVDFISVSRLLLVEDKSVRCHLEQAEEKVKEGDYLEALIEAKKAFYVARPSNHTFVSKDSFFSSFFLTSSFRDIEALREPIGRIVDKVNDLEDSIALLMMGVDVIKLRRFEQITPHFVFSVNGDCGIYWVESITPTGKMVQEAIGYVIDMTLLWQGKGVIGSRPEWSQAGAGSGESWREVRREKWHFTQGDRPAGDAGGIAT
jgi:hypothetical protein